ncbi:MAG: serine/threonine protein kinase [Rubrivivax sp.]|nr:serine/threonine protein kinase [Rubrivivax sp.]
MAADGFFDLDAAQWQRLRQLLDQGLELPAAARAAWLEALDDGCGGRLKPRLASMLARATDPAAAVQRSLDSGPRLAGDPHDTVPAGTLDTSPGRVGPYRLLRVLGRGGMATVWLAERTDMLQGRQVALKLPRGAWPREGLAERLAREREILATLEHPHIARLYDAGVDEQGNPWLAIEYVDGVRLDQHFHERDLGLRDRVRVMLQVCDAVAYAHARLIVHRDLKPANILIDRQGQVKLLDFGIARLLEGEAAAGAESTLAPDTAMTPTYAAPEQLRGEPLGTAVDVYAIGLLLFELLAGRRPFEPRGGGFTVDPAALDAAAPRASEVAIDPRAARALRGDLDGILAKALQPRPADRYLTVAALADDLRRHLADEPLAGLPQGRLLRWRKFVRRHRPVAAALAAAVLALVGGSGVALWQAAEARAQRDLALAAQARAEAETAAARVAERAAAAEADLASFLLSDHVSTKPGQEMVDQLGRATEMVRAQYQDQPSLRARMLVNLAMNYRWVSLHEQAGKLFDEAEPLLRRHGPPSGLAQLLCTRASALAFAGKLDEAREQVAAARALLREGGAEVAMRRGDCLLEEAWVLRLAARPMQAAELAEQAVREYASADRAVSEQTSEALNVLARARQEAGEYAAALDAARRSIAMLERIGRTATPGMRNAWGLVARALRDGGQLLQAEPAHGGHGRFDPASPDMPTPVRTDYAQTLALQGRIDEALPIFDGVIAQALREGSSSQHRFTMLYRMQALIDSGRLAQAEQARPQVEAVFTGLRRQRSARVRQLLLALAALDLATGRPQAAAARLEELAQVQAGAGPETAAVRRERTELLARLALARGDAAAARALAEDTLAQARTAAIDPQASLGVARALLLQAQVQAAAGDAVRARELAADAAAHAERAAGPANPVTRMAAARAR